MYLYLIYIDNIWLLVLSKFHRGLAKSVRVKSALYGTISCNIIFRESYKTTYFFRFFHVLCSTLECKEVNSKHPAVSQRSLDKYVNVYKVSFQETDEQGETHFFKLLITNHNNGEKITIRRYFKTNFNKWNTAPTHGLSQACIIFLVRSWRPTPGFWWKSKPIVSIVILLFCSFKCTRITIIHSYTAFRVRKRKRFRNTTQSIAIAVNICTRFILGKRLYILPTKGTWKP